MSPGPPQVVVPGSIVKATEPTGSPGGGQVGSVVLVTVVLVLDVVVVVLIGDAVLVVVAGSELVVVVPARVVVVHRGIGEISWLTPVRLTAPGPGRSPAASTVALKVGGTQKTLTRWAACEVPSSMHTPAGDPVSLMVRAGPCAKAPEVRCRQNANVASVHWLSVVQGTAGFWNFPNPLPQKPQNLKGCDPTGPGGSLVSTAVVDCVPVDNAKGMGRLPMKAADAGGQS